jgi:hypothetical protein
MHLMCHGDAYTDQALAGSRQAPVHHNGSNCKNPRSFLVHRGRLGGAPGPLAQKSRLP